MQTDVVKVTKLIPSKGMHLKNILTNEIAEGVIYLGKLDSTNNYIEVSEEEYQDYLKQEEEKAHANREQN